MSQEKSCNLLFNLLCLHLILSHNICNAVLDKNKLSFLFLNPLTGGWEYRQEMTF